MHQRKNIENQIREFHQLNENIKDLNSRLDELILLFEKSNLDTEMIKKLHPELLASVNKATSFRQSLKVFELLDEGPQVSRVEMIDNIDFLLAGNQFDSRQSRKYLWRKKLKKLVIVLAGLVFITMGIGMIVMPAPPYFEMFTIYHFTINDGVTLMDLISLLIVLSGVYLLINAATE